MLDFVWWDLKKEKKRESYLSGTHGGFKGGEAVIKGAENGDNVVSDSLAFLQ